MLASIYDEMVESVSHLSHEEQAKVIYAYVRYQLYQEVPEVGTREYDFISAKKFDLDSMRLRSEIARENGKKGGRPRKDLSVKNLLKTKKTQAKPNDNQTETKPKPKKSLYRDIDIEKEIEKEKEKKTNKRKYSEDFEKFWNTYPNKKGKVKSFEARVKVLNSGVDPTHIIKKATEYATECKLKHTEERYIKRPQGRLNDGRYDDDYYTGSTEKKEIDLDKLY